MANRAISLPVLATGLSLLAGAAFSQQAYTFQPGTPLNVAENALHRACAPDRKSIDQFKAAKDVIALYTSFDVAAGCYGGFAQANAGTAIGERAADHEVSQNANRVSVETGYPLYYIPKGF